MKKNKKLNIILKIPFNLPAQETLKMGQSVLTELLKERDWNGIVENETTITHTGYDYTQDDLSIVEFKIVISPETTKDELMKIALTFINWLRDVD